MLGFLPCHTFLWDCMENFVEHYNSHIWGNQGPKLMRMLRLWCKLEDFQGMSDFRTSNLYFLHPQRFHPISYPQRRRYCEVRDNDPSFKNLCCKYCPSTYRNLIQGPVGLVTRELCPGNK